MRKRLDELADIIERSETDSRGIDQHRERLQRQMRTVIAPREAEALQHEIATLDTRRNALDDDELAALEEQARIDDDLSELLSQEAALRAAFLDADAVMSAAETDIDGELVRTTDRIATLRGEIDAKTLKRYDRLREHHLVAAATLSGSRCDGCHLDLSAHEVDDVKEAGEGGGLAECPQCGRILIV